uniref:Salivary lipocalin n=1 Tax=Steinernema glaseri TaxID=37863 RepID=A0A1I7XYH9_9BILA
MKRILLLSLASFCLGTTYVQNLPTGTVVFGTEGKVLTRKFQPRDCVLAWKERSMLPKTFIYNSKKKTCTPLTSVLGTKKAADGEEAYFIESSEDICQRNVTKAVEDITDCTAHMSVGLYHKTVISKSEQMKKWDALMASLHIMDVQKSTSTTTAKKTTTTTTTEAPWSQEVVVLRDPEADYMTLPQKKRPQKKDRKIQTPQ